MESQHTEWKESWCDDYLRWICGFANAEGGVPHIGVDDKGNPSGLKDPAKLLEDLPNKIPDIANAFFRAGEIEAWGQGIQRIFDACKAGGIPFPSLSHKGVDLWTEFSFSEQYLAAVATPTNAASVSEKSSEKILRLLNDQPDLTIAKLAEELGMTTRAIEKQLRNLQQNQKLRRVGPAKGGHWEVKLGPTFESE